MANSKQKEKHSIYIRLLVVAGVIFGFCAAECKESAVETKTKIKKFKTKIKKVFRGNKGGD